MVHLRGLCTISDNKTQTRLNIMYQSYSVDKRDDGGPEMTWREVLNKVADKDLWDGVKREQRPEWQKYLSKADEISRKPRKPISKVGLFPTPKLHVLFS